MNVTQRIIDLALIRIFKRAPRAGLSFFDLGEHWFATGLRSADLREALHRFAEMRYLQSESSTGLTTFRLSEELIDKWAIADGPLSPETAEEKRILLSLSRRKRSGYQPEMARRIDDRARNGEVFLAR